MRILSLCTGYGGLDLAVEAVTGARTVAVSDIDKGACKILAHRLPDVPNLGDLKAIDWAAWRGTEILTAGYPCQPFSHAGKREGTDDPRHIFPYIAEGIRVVGPELVVLENVRGHLALGFDTVLGTLADIGYDARWVCVRASDVGAPHRRERLFIVATPQDTNGSARGERRLAAPGEAKGGWPRSDAGRRGGAPTADAHGSGLEGGKPAAGRLLPAWGPPANAAGNARRVGDRDGGFAADTSRDGWHQGWTEPAGLLRRPDAAERGASPLADSNRRDAGEILTGNDGIHQQRAPFGWGPELAIGAGGDGFTAGRRSTGTPSPGQPTTPGDFEDREGLATDWGQYAPAVHRWEAVLGRPAPAPTEPGAKGQPRLSPRFVEFMMGLPAGWVTDVPDLTRNEQLKALGNGVVPQQAAAALTHLLDLGQVAA